MKKSRLTTMIITVLYIAFFLCSNTGALAELAEGKTGNLTWKLSDDGVLTISGTGEMGCYSEKDDSVVWKPYNQSIEKIVIEKGVTRIGWCAFCNCTNLKSVSIPDTVVKIDLKAFKNCHKLTTVSVPESVKEIGDQAFYCCGVTEELSDYSLSFTKRSDFELFISEPGLVLKVKKESFAEQYAIKHQISYDNGEFVPGLKKKILDKADAIIAECIRPNMNEREKAKALHNWIIYHAHYEVDPIQVAVGEDIFLSGYGTCESYTYAYSFLLYEAGIANAKIHGTANGEEHFWNYVRIDGKWYHVDTTYDDPYDKQNRARSGYENSKYFMLTDEKMKRNHSWNENKDEPDRRYQSFSDFYDPDQ